MRRSKFNGSTSRLEMHAREGLRQLPHIWLGNTEQDQHDAETSFGKMFAIRTDKADTVAKKEQIADRMYDVM
ncbi:MAG: hypothetical protein BroJett013_09380 [Alphaproteobacteria bacterium]|nr:MAG: hypothetical protein BroJett013_09380 [Alphaproteobacteria bacterium]